MRTPSGAAFFFISIISRFYPEIFINNMSVLSNGPRLQHVFSESNSGNLTSNFEVPQMRAFEVGRSEFDVGS